MLSAVSTGTDLVTRIRKLFSQYPVEELQLLNIAARAHFSGNTRELKDAINRMVSNGELAVVRRGGGRYYRRYHP
ncbi:MAG TPA: hypothetical protein PLP42_07930 [Acidobacteriota bacterium]|nr:hypothetical protein [Acidobacteriota bacterium]